jgi:hypothetical protein
MSRGYESTINIEFLRLPFPTGLSLLALDNPIALELLSCK